MSEKQYVVRMYDKYWFDVTRPVSKEEAEAEWDKLTKGGKQYTERSRDGSYYHVFPANTRMIFDEDPTTGESF